MNLFYSAAHVFTRIYEAVQQMPPLFVSNLSFHHAHLCSLPSTHTCLLTLQRIQISIFWFTFKVNVLLFLLSARKALPTNISGSLFLFQVCAQITSSQRGLPPKYQCSHLSLSSLFSLLQFFSETLSPPSIVYIFICLLFPFTH